MALNPKSFFPNDSLAQNMALAAMRGDVNRLNQLHSQGADVRAKGLRDMTLPHFALHAPDPSALIWLLQHGADPVSILPTGATVPHYALSKKDAKRQPTAAWIEPLLKHGVSPDLVGDEGRHTLLVMAVIFDNLPAVIALKQAGANMNLTPSPLSGTAIHWALTKAKLDLAGQLADLGVDPRVKRSLGELNLNAAEQYCRYLSGSLIGPEREASYARMVKAFAKWGLTMPCGF